MKVWHLMILSIVLLSIGIYIGIYSSYLHSAQPPPCLWRITLHANGQQTIWESWSPPSYKGGGIEFTEALTKHKIYLQGVISAEEKDR